MGVAVREYQTDVGPADYVLFVDKKPVGVIEAKREDEGFRLTQVEDQSLDYAQAKLKYLNNSPLPFVYESTGEVHVLPIIAIRNRVLAPFFRFISLETFREWLKQPETLRNSFQKLPVLPIDRMRDCQIRAIANLDKSFKINHPKALIQMATGQVRAEYARIAFIY